MQILCDMKKISQTSFCFKNVATKLDSNLGHLAYNQINKNKNAGKIAAKMAVYYKKNKKIFPETGELQGFACGMLILLILKL